MISTTVKQKQILGVSLFLFLFFVVSFIPLLFLNELYIYIFISIISVIFLNLFDLIYKDLKFNFCLLFSCMWFLYTIGPVLKALTSKTSVSTNYPFIFFLSIISLISFVVGNKININSVKKFDLKIFFYHKNIMILILCVLTFLLICSRLYSINVVGLSSYFTDSRAYIAKITAERVPSIVSIFLSFEYFLIPFALQLYLNEKKLKHNGIIFLILFFILIITALGFSVLRIDRSDFLFSILPTIFILYANNKLPFMKIVIIGISLFVLFILWKTLISGFVRGVDFDLNLVSIIPAEIFSWNTVFDNILEYTKSLPFSFKYGYTYLKGFESLLNPFFDNYESLSVLYVKSVNYDYYLAGSGYGFSFLAESYLNFGMFGSFLVYLFLGRLVSIIEFHASKNLYYLVFYATLMPSCYKVFRSEFYSIVKLNWWTAAIPLLLIFFINILCMRKSNCTRSD